MSDHESNQIIVQDTDKAISVIKNAAQWLHDSGIDRTKWWDPKNMNRKYLDDYADEDEFFVLLIDDKPAAAAIIQQDQVMQDWSDFDNDEMKDALYIHYVAVHRDFAGQNLVKPLIDFAEDLAKQKNITTLRLDTNAEKPKLRNIYEKLGFKAKIEFQEDHQVTVLYEKDIKF